MRTRHSHGFTILELGIVIAIAMILLSAVASTATSFYRTARQERTGSELASLSQAAANVARRGLVQNGGSFQFSDTGQGPFNNFPVPMVPFCYDLTQFAGGGTCPATKAAGPAFNNLPAGAVAAPLGPSSQFLKMAGGSRVYNNGYNPWCERYVACIYPTRADIYTCVPSADTSSAGLQGTVTCGTCGNTSPVTGEPTTCVMASATTYTAGAQEAQLNRNDVPAGFATLPGTYAPNPAQGQ